MNSVRLLRPESTSRFADGLYGLVEWGRRVRRWPERRAIRRRAARLQFCPQRTLCLNLGRVEPVAPGRPIGGEIKYLHLRQRFGEHFDRGNIIYVVSSAMPPQVAEVVRYAKARGAKFVWNQNGIAYPGFYGDFYPWFNRPMAEMLRLADHVVYQSEFCRRSADRYLGTSSGPSEILFNPVDTEQFRPPDEPLTGDTWRLLCAGTNHSFYRVRAPLEALKILRDRGHDVHLVIAGEFRWRGGRAEVERALKHLGVGNAVSLQPPFAQGQAPDLYRAAHVLLHAKDKDPCPTVPIEAMACGVPVVASRSGGLPELVPPTAGRLVPVESGWTADYAPDPGVMADAVEEIMASRESFAREARRHAVQTFEVGRWLDRHEEIFKGVLGY